MEFDPKPTKYPFPEITDRHYIILKKNNGAVFDEDYPYLDLSFAMRFRQSAVRALLYTIVFPIARIRLGLRIKGRKNLKKHKNELKNGAISVSNHVHFWDFIAVMRALLPYKPYIPVWDMNVRGESASLIRSVRGIPVPIGDIHAVGAFNKAIEKILCKGWLHVYSEGSMWEYYRPIRPFKTGAAYYACKYKKPVVPLAFSYREPGFIRKKVFRQTALFDLAIGEPLYPDESLPLRKRIDDLTERSHARVCELAGISPEENLYPPIFADSKRVDYYTDKYGVQSPNEK